MSGIQVIIVIEARLATHCYCNSFSHAAVTAGPDKDREKGLQLEACTAVQFVRIERGSVN